MGTDENFLDDHTFLGDGHPDTLDQRLAREVPDNAAEEVPYDRQPDAVGELVAVPDDEEFTEQDVMAEEAGPARDDAGAEQAAMHVFHPDAPAVEEEDYSASSSDVDDEDDEEDEESEDTDEDDSSEGFERDDTSGEFVFDAEYDED